MFTSSFGFELPYINIVLNLLIASLIGIIIRWGYTKTHVGFSFSYTFTSTLLLITPIAALVMMVIGNNVARAFGLVGAFSIIRFRTVIKDIKDTTVILLAIVSGMAAGSNNYALAFSGVAVVLLLLLMIQKVKLPFFSSHWYLLTFQYKRNMSASKFESLLRKYVSSFNAVHITIPATGLFRESAYNIIFKREADAPHLLEELARIPGIKQPQISSLIGEVS